MKSLLLLQGLPLTFFYKVEHFRSALKKCRGAINLFIIMSFSLIKGYKRDIYKNNYLNDRNTESAQGF